MPIRACCFALALPACAPEDAGPVSACPLDETVRLHAPPDNWRPHPNQFITFSSFGDRILYRFEPFPTYWLIDRCGGEPERVALPDPETRPLGGLETDEGLVLYGLGPGNRPLVLDRLDVPGVDEPRPIAGLPDEWFFGYPTIHGFYLFTLRLDSGSLREAAGIGANDEGIYIHHGDAAAPAVTIGDRVIELRFLDDRLLALDDDGSLRVVDPRTGASERMLAGVRHFDLAAAARRLIWQQIGDDSAELVFLRDLDSGVDIAIALNDFAALSWNRADGPNSGSTGQWLFTSDQAYAALHGPGHVPAAVVRTDTGAPVSPPAGVRLLDASLGPGFILAVDEDGDRVLAEWDPRTGALLEWYRGAPDGPGAGMFARADDHLDYGVADPDGGSATLWRLDLASGERTVLVPRIGPYTAALADGRYFTAIRESTSFSSPSDLVVFDPDTGRYTTIARDVIDHVFYPDQGLVYLDARGLWAAPIPAK